MDSSSVIAIDIDTPSIPVKTKENVIFYSLITILWWVAIWGLTETVMTLLVKNSILYRLGIYLSILAFVFVMLLYKPKLIEYL
jgi:hypothetical protein